MKKINFITILMVTAFLALGCSEGKQGEAQKGNIPTINAEGRGIVEIVPDEAIVRFGVKTEKKTLEKAYEKNTKSINNIIKAAKSIGVKGKDVKTSSYSIMPIYPKDEKGRTVQGKPMAFSVNQQLTVVARNILKVGDLIDRVVASGTNTFNGIQFTSSKIAELKKEAKGKAAKDAKVNAEILAKSLGVKIGKLMSVDDTSVQPYPRRGAVYATSMVRSSPNIQIGSMEVSVTCNVVYEIVQ